MRMMCKCRGTVKRVALKLDSAMLSLLGSSTCLKRGVAQDALSSSLSPNA